MDIRQNWENGKLSQICVHEATGSYASDLYGDGGRTITIQVYGDEQEVVVYLRPAVARELFESLRRMFVVEEPSEQVGFPSEIKPVAGLERG